MKINAKSIGVFVLTLFWLVSVLSAQNPRLLNYQGKLVGNNNAMPSGTYSMVFTIYADSAGRNQVWQESHSAVAVTNGLFNVLLGSVLGSLNDSLFNKGGNRYLGIRVDKEKEMRPLFQLTSVPYAIHANSATTLSAPPVVGRWYATNHDAPGPVNYQWGTEILNTDPTCLARTSLNYEIEVKKAGYYLICVNALQKITIAAREADVHLLRNGSSIASSLGFADASQYCKHNLTIIESFQAGDKITVQCANNQIYAAGGVWSTLEIYKLN